MSKKDEKYAQAEMPRVYTDLKNKHSSLFTYLSN